MTFLGEFNWNNYPTIGAAGLFFIGIGLGFILVWLYPKHYGIFMGFAFALAVCGAVLGYLIFEHLGKIRRIDIAVYTISLIIEIAGIIFVTNSKKDERTQDSLILMVVALHFFPMILILGPLAGVLAILCLFNAFLSLRDKKKPILLYGLVDSGLKIVAGSLMVFLYAA